jgi:outer membrane protein TolC
MSRYHSQATRRSQGLRNTAFALLGLLAGSGGAGVHAQDPVQRIAVDVPGNRVDLTLERLLQLTLSNSYEVRFLNMSVQQTQLRLRAERARLRSNVSLDISAPQFTYASEPRWNSQLGLFETVREDSRHWEAQLSIRQPVILFGYPTNGYLSLNNRMYRDDQRSPDGEKEVTFYNRYFIQYTQPLFQANSLKNSLEEAELDLEDAQIEYNGDMMEMIEEVSENYFELFENAYQQTVEASFVANLEAALQAAQEAAAANPARAIEPDQIRVELANAREELQSSQSRFRIETARLKTELNLAEEVNIVIDPVIDFTPVQVNVEEATRYATELTPRLRQLAMDRREGEIQLEETRSQNGFRMDLEFSYGREKRDEFLRELWGEPENTYTIDVNARVPIWDWGARKARIEAQQINLARTDLQVEQAEIQIVSNVTNEIRNLEELQGRVIAMQDNLELARNISVQSLERYRAGAITALDLLQSLRRESDTAENYLEAYTSWRRVIQELQQMTYWDFETSQPVLQRFSIDTSTVFGGS